MDEPQLMTISSHMVPISILAYIVENLTLIADKKALILFYHYKENKISELKGAENAVQETRKRQ